VIGLQARLEMERFHLRRTAARFVPLPISNPISASTRMHDLTLFFRLHPLPPLRVASVIA
jgi:hypothetical protein